MNSPRSSSFAWAIRLLPAKQRRAMAALYGFCRFVDDIADGTHDDKSERLECCRQDLLALVRRDPVTLPQIAALAPLLTTYQIPPDALTDILDGVSSDISHPFHAPTWDELKLYCRRVAGAVGVAILHILERTDMMPLAHPLGEALQLTNILRDRETDAAMNRLYLPAPALQSAGIAVNQPVDAVLAHPALPDALKSVADQAERDFQIAENLLTRRSTARLWPVLIMMQTYRLTLERMRCNGFRARPLSSSQRLWIALCVRMKAFFTS